MKTIIFEQTLCEMSHFLYLNVLLGWILFQVGILPLLNTVRKKSCKCALRSVLVGHAERKSLIPCKWLIYNNIEYLRAKRYYYLINNMLEGGLLIPVNSLYDCPVRPVKTVDDSWRQTNYWDSGKVVLLIASAVLDIVSTAQKNITG
jgi:hypothetical protein